MPIAQPAKSGDVALAGKDGTRANALIDKSQDTGIDVLYRIMQSALPRLLSRGPIGAQVADSLFNPSEMQQFVAHMSKVVAAGDLLGRSRIREKMMKADAAGGFHRFAERDELPFAFIQPGASIPLLPPEQALAYFRGLVPMLGVDPLHYGPAMFRTAFTMCVATEATLLASVQALIADRMQMGVGVSTAPADIESLIYDAGVAPLNPQYSQMVYRTNAMESYNAGTTLEVNHPDVRDFFPVWQYLGIHDGREGDDHRPHFNKYYPRILTFQQIRGKRVYNCRCLPNYLDKYQWADLQAKGAKLSYD